MNSSEVRQRFGQNLYTEFGNPLSGSLLSFPSHAQRLWLLQILYPGSSSQQDYIFPLEVDLTSGPKVVKQNPNQETPPLWCLSSSCWLPFGFRLLSVTFSSWFLKTFLWVYMFYLWKSWFNWGYLALPETWVSPTTL